MVMFRSEHHITLTSEISEAYISPINNKWVGDENATWNKEYGKFKLAANCGRKTALKITSIY